MCIVSVIMDYGRTINWNQDSFRSFKDLVEVAKVVDSKLSQPNCDSSEKKDWFREWEKQLFQQHCEEATKIVQTWPEWKKNVLGKYE